jgi:LPXTG-motif cell wall-anchored protein
VLAVRRRSKLLPIATAVALIGGLSLLGNTAFAAQDPSGNNGTVKIHDGTSDTDPAVDSDPQNVPHVDCPFTVTFFGFDTGDVATVTFTAWAPTGKGALLQPPDTVDIGADDNSGGGSPAGFDGAKTYELTFDGIEAQPQQGYHVRLDVTVTSQGSSTPKFDKYKVFWVQPCDTSGGGSSGTTTTTTTTTPPGGGDESDLTTTTSSTVLGGGGGGAGGESVAAKSGLPKTGSNALPLMIAGLALLALGGASLVASRRQRRQKGA